MVVLVVSVHTACAVVSVGAIMVHVQVVCVNMVHVKRTIVRIVKVNNM